MSTNKNINLICIIAAVFMVIVTVLFINGEALGLVAEKSNILLTSYTTTIDLANIDNLATDQAYYYDGDLIIGASGTYTLTGTLESEHSIIVNSKGGQVDLVLDNVTIENDSVSAIIVKKAGTVYITSAAGSENVLSVASAIADNDYESTAVIYSTADLIFDGDGVLNVNGAAAHAIRGNDNLTVDSGTINIAAGDSQTAHDMGVNKDGNTSTHNTENLNGTTLSTSETDTTDEDNITLNEYDSNNTQNYGNKAQSNNKVDDSSNLTSDNKSNLKMPGGSGGMGMPDGAGSTCYDALHANDTLTINGGTINITQSGEGIEATQIIVNGGDISVVSSDDGFNCSNSDDVTQCLLQINDGTIYVDASGDGLDSNYDIEINGGTVYVDGPTNAGNGALDSGLESGGTIITTGGTTLALGMSGMAESFNTGSTQACIDATFDSEFSAGDKLCIKDATGNVIFTYTINKSGNNVIFSCAKLKNGSTYTVTVGELETTVSAGMGSQSSGGMMSAPTPGSK